MEMAKAPQKVLLPFVFLEEVYETNNRSCAAGRRSKKQFMDASRIYGRSGKSRRCSCYASTYNSGLFRLLNRKSLSVNSYHHQAIKEKARPLKIMAVADDGIIEAVEMTDKKFVWGIQWHPEFSYKSDENSRLIFEEFVRKCIE